MYRDILNEELGIANKVTEISTKIRNLVSDDYARNINTNRYVNLSIRISNFVNRNKKLKAFNDIIIINPDSDNIKVRFYVVDVDSYDSELITLYKEGFDSSFDIETCEITLFLLSKNNKIVWRDVIEDIQHEIEHWYEQKEKGKSLLNKKVINRYKKYQKLRRSSYNFERIIGMVYYYYEKFERNAIMNGLYSKIMEYNEIDYVIDPIEVLKDYIHYKNIKTLKDILNLINNDEAYKEEWIEMLKKHNKSLESFIRVTNIVVNEYIKAFGRTIYKARKDLEEMYKTKIH